MPIPPSDAKAIAILASVTVSIAAEQKGRFKSMFLVNFVLSDTCFGRRQSALARPIHRQM